MIAAMARKRVIGRENAMPWHLPEDLKHFKRLTLGHPVVMGRKTYESIGRPLPGRENIVITRSASLALPGVRVVTSLNEALELTQGKPAFVIGGAEIYRLALPLADCLHLTEIDIDVDGDTFFPEFDRSEWEQAAREESPAGAEPSYAFVTYLRRNRTS